MSTTLTNRAIQVGSVEYLLAIIGAQVDGAGIDPTNLPVQMAVRPTSSTAAQTWHTAEWETLVGAGPAGADLYCARVLVGTDPLVLAAGPYRVYTKVTDTPEAPVVFCGLLQMLP